MQVISINSAQNAYSIHNRAKINQNSRINYSQRLLKDEPEKDTVSFKGDTGAALGVFGGMATGALTAAIIVASGGLAAPVAAIGLAGVMGTGAACGTHIGGVIGSVIEDKFF